MCVHACATFLQVVAVLSTLIAKESEGSSKGKVKNKASSNKQNNSSGQLAASFASDAAGVSDKSGAVGASTHGLLASANNSSTLGHTRSQATPAESQSSGCCVIS